VHKINDSANQYLLKSGCSGWGRGEYSQLAYGAISNYAHVGFMLRDSDKEYMQGIQKPF
jgi:hypothetical protein